MMLRLPAAVALSLALLVGAAAPAAAAHGGTAKEGAKKKDEPNILEPRLDLTIWTIVVFGLLLLVLRKYAWGPMLEGLQRREQTIRAALDDAGRLRGEAEQLRAQFQAEMDRAQDQVRALLDEARRNGQRAAEEMLNKAKADAQAERERGRREIALATDQALQQIAAQTANLATLVSSKVIRRELRPEDHRQLVDEALAELNQGRRKNGQG